MPGASGQLEPDRLANVIAPFGGSREVKLGSDCEKYLI